MRARLTPRRTTLPWLMACCAHTAFAQSPAPVSPPETCPGHEQAPWPQSASEVAALDQQLDAAMASCATDPVFLAYRGAWMLHRGEAEQAAILLERALMLAPEFAGAQVDYVSALAGIGDHASAQALRAQLLERKDIPSQARASLESLAIRPKPAGLTNGWQGALSLTYRHGRDTNLNGAPLRDALTLTLPDGDAILALGEAFRPRAGTASIVDLRAVGLRSINERTALQVSLDARRRLSESASYSQAETGAALRQRMFARHTLVVSVARSNMVYEGLQLLSATRWQVMDEWMDAEQACRVRAGVERDRRDYGVTPGLNGSYLGLTGFASCRVGNLTVGGHWRGGIDRARTSERPGGDQRKQELRGLISIPWGSWRWDAEWAGASLRDASGYSPLLAQGTTREQRRHYMRIELTRKLSSGWEVFATAERIKNHSNLALFESQGTAYWLGLRWQGP